MQKAKRYILLSILTFIFFTSNAQIKGKKTAMKTPDFTTTLWVDQTSQEAFEAIINPRAWWSEEIAGGTAKLNDEFDYHYEDVHHCHIKLTEVIANKKIVWLVTDNYFKFTRDKTEWTGTKIIFDISEKDGKIQIVFTHQGLTPEYECFEICRDAWTNYIQNSLYNLITTGKGAPNGKGKPQTDNEKKLGSGNNITSIYLYSNNLKQKYENQKFSSSAMFNHRQSISKSTSKNSRIGKGMGKI